ncbi:MAG: hypothetical protein K2X87_18460 [Gemmataceae bacterium]|nr:hypothetical protein [Gemmataceae bacterium]
MSRLFAQVGMGFDPVRFVLILFWLGFAAAGVAVWLFLVVGSGGRGPKVPRLGPLPRAVGLLLAAAAGVLWGVYAWAAAVEDERSRAVLPYATAAAVAAVSVLVSTVRGTRLR